MYNARQPERIQKLNRYIQFKDNSRESNKILKISKDSEIIQFRQNRKESGRMQKKSRQPERIWKNPGGRERIRKNTRDYYRI